MPLTFDQHQQLYNGCDPQRTLPSDDRRIVDLDREYRAIRGETWVKKIADRIVFTADEPDVMFFSGLPGSGKSTELRRLAATLSSDSRGQKKFFPVLIDARETLDLTATVDVADILSIIVAMTSKTVLEAEGKNPDDALHDSPLTRLWAFLNSDIVLSKVEVGVGASTQIPASAKLDASAKAVVEIKDNPTLREQIRKRVANSTTEFIRLVHREIDALNARVKKLEYHGLVIIFDSLEQLQGTPDGWQSVQESAEKLFLNRAPHLVLPVHALYTVPPSVLVRIELDVDYLPMIKIETRDGKRFDEGYHAASKLISQRISDAEMAEIFGTEWEKRRDDIIHMSGGYPREILRLLRAMILKGTFPLTKPDFDTVISRQGESYRRIALMSGSLELMARIQYERRLIVNNDEERIKAARLLQGNLVLRYVNDTEWNALHPAVRSIPEIELYAKRMAAKKAREEENPS